MGNKKKKPLETIILVGPPGAGKTTWCNDFLSKNPKFVRLSRDEMRFAWRNTPVITPRMENMLTMQLDEQARFFLSQNMSVIIDATNVQEKYIQHWIDVCRPYSDVRCQIFDISLEKVLQRNAFRTRFVPENVVKKMFDQFQGVLQGTLVYEIHKCTGFLPHENQLYTASPTQEQAYLFDLDGTLAWNIANKRSYFDGAQSDKDAVNTQLRTTLRKLKFDGTKIIVLTGRMGDDETEKACLRWLDANDIPFDEIYMRADGDFRKDYVIKEEIYRKFIEPRYFVLGVFDDRETVCAMWRRIGLTTFQVDRRTW